MNVACEVCGNHYDKGFAVTTEDGTAHRFDCFECAIHSLAPACDHCGCRVIGHGFEDEAGLYCCEHCAREASGVPSERPA